MSGYGIAAFVDGFKGGYDWRQGVEQKKIDRQRQSKMDERGDIRFEREQQVWKQQDEDRMRRQAATARAQANAAYERGLFRDADAAARGEGVPGAPVRDPGVADAPMPSRQDMVERGVAPRQDQRGQQISVRDMPQSMNHGEPGALPGAPAPDAALAQSRGVGGNGPAQGPSALNVPPDAIYAPAADEQSGVPQATGNTRPVVAVSPRLSRPEPEPVSSPVPGEGRNQGRTQAMARPSSSFNRSVQQQVPQQVRELARQADVYASILERDVSPMSGARMTAEERAIYRQRYINASRGVRNWVEQRAPINDPMVTPQQSFPPAAQRGPMVPAQQSNAPAVQNATRGLGVPSQRDITPPVQAQISDPDVTPADVGRQATGAIAQEPTPSAQSAQDAATAAVQAAPESQRQAARSGSDAPVKATKTQLDKGSKAYIDRWFDVGLPIVVEGYLARGQVDKAMAFQQWADTRNAKKGMEAVGKGLAAASIGDFDTMAENLAEAYNTAGFFDDGFTVDRARTGPIKDRKGDIVGVNIAFKDDSGKVFEQQVRGGMAELVPLFATAISPEKAFEYHYERARAATVARAESIKSERDFNEWVQKEMIKAGLKGDGRREELIGMIKSIEENWPLGQMRPSQEELVQMAIERMQLLEQATGGRGATTAASPPPVLRRPE